MIRRPPRSTRTDNLFPYTTLFRSRDAITALAATEVDVLVLDLEMPRMDGLSALPEILNTTSAAVLVVSSLTTQGARSTIEALRLGAADTLAKPELMLGCMARSEERRVGQESVSTR